MEIDARIAAGPSSLDANGAGQTVLSNRSVSTIRSVLSSEVTSIRIGINDDDDDDDDCCGVDMMIGKELRDLQSEHCALHYTL